MTFRSLLLLSLLAAAADALQCDCGFIDPLDPNQALYTHYFETNFSTSTQINLQYRALKNNLTKTTGLARYFIPENVGLDAEGVKLTVSAYQADSPNVYGAELETNQTDLWYGSYHVSARLPSVPGTVSAFFLYQSDSNEVDVEWVSRDVPTPILFSVKPQDFDEHHHAMDTTLVTYMPPNGVNFSTDFHTYSFVWEPTNVTFLVDGDQTRPLVKNVPTLPCQLAISHWSDGNPNYSGGPPLVDTSLTVNRVWAFYNSSNGGGMECVNSKAPCGYGEYVMPTLPTTSSTNTQTSSNSTTPSPKPGSALSSVNIAGMKQWMVMIFIVFISSLHAL